MATYQSDHEVYAELTEEELIERWSEYLFKNMNLDCNEDGYTFWIFKDGTQIINQSSTCWLYDEEGNENKEEIETTNNLQQKAQTLAKEKNERAKAAKAKAEEEANRKRTEYEKLRRAAEYEKLKKEFEQVGA